MKYTEKSKQSPRIPITVKHILKASETMIYNVNAMTLLYGNTKLQYQLIWKPIAEQNSRNEMFVLDTFGSIVNDSSVPRFVQIYRDLSTMKVCTSYRDFVNIDDKFWDLKRKLWRKASVTLKGRSRRTFPWNDEQLLEKNLPFASLQEHFFEDLNIKVKNPIKKIEAPVRICVFSVEALKKEVFPTLFRHIPLPS